MACLAEGKRGCHHAEKPVKTGMKEWVKADTIEQLKDLFMPLFYYMGII